MAEERLQKILSACGFGSRRDCEKLIRSGVVSINGKPAELGEKADIQSDNITVRGKKATVTNSQKAYIILNKPQYVLSDIKRSRGRKIVTDLIDTDRYLFIVGRLDYHSEGLILLTDDGDLANQLTHPRYEHEKEYRVLLSKKPNMNQIKQWREGVQLQNGYFTMPAEVDVISNKGDDTWLRIILKEGKKRQIREVGKRLGLRVERIIRTRIGPIELGSLKSGTYRPLTSNEIKALLDAIS